MKEGPSNLILTVFGRKGSGKTTLVKSIIPEFRRVIVLDTNGEYGDVVEIVFTDLAEALDYLVAVSETDAPFTMSYVPDDALDDGLDFLRMAFEVPDVMLIVDEAHMYCAAHTMPRPIQSLVRLGRHREISQIYIAQRPASLPRDLTAQSDLVVSFQQHEGRDIEYMARLYGRSAESLKTLSPYTVEAFGDLDRAPLAVHAAMAKRPVDRQLKLL